MTERRLFTVCLLGTSRPDTPILLMCMRSLAIGEVVLYDGPSAVQGQLEAKMLAAEMNINSNTQYLSSSDLSDVERCDICILWGYSFVETGGESLIAVRKLFVAMNDELRHTMSHPVFLFPDGMSGLIYANMLNQLHCEEWESLGNLADATQEKPEIRVISSISLLSNSVFGNSPNSACAWPTTTNQFFVEDGENDDKCTELDFYREYMAQKKRPLISEACSMAEATKLIAVSGNTRNIDEHLCKRMKVVGRLPSKQEAGELEMDYPYIVFLRADHSALSELAEVKNTIKSTIEETKRVLNFLN